jgi:hypothetical protein
MPAITVLTRLKSNKHDEMVAAGRKAKALIEKHGAELYRVSKFHTGQWVGEWLVVSRYSCWSAFASA